MKKSMIDIAQDFLQKNKESTFNQIWGEISKELKNDWKNEETTLKLVDLEEQKKAQFYKLLTLDGRFLRLRNAKWILAEEYSFNEANKLKVFYNEAASSDDKEIDNDDYEIEPDDEEEEESESLDDDNKE